MVSKKYDFCDVYYQPGESPVFCYRNGLAVYEEILDSGLLYCSNWNSAGFVSNMGEYGKANRVTPGDYFTEPSSFNLEIDGKSADYGYEFADFKKEKTTKGVHAVLSLKSTVHPIMVYVHTELDGTQTMSRYIEVENLSDKPLCVSRMAPISCKLTDVVKRLGRGSNVVGEKEPNLEDYFSIGYFDMGGWGREGDFSWHKLERDITVIDMRYYRERYRQPMIFIKNNVLGSMWYCQLAWTAGCRFELSHSGYIDRNESGVNFRSQIASHNPMLVIKGKETFKMPEVHMGLIQGDFDDAVNCMHAHTRNITLPETRASLCGVIATMATECDMTVESTKKYIDRYSELGVEIFIIDAGWQCPPGRHGEHRKFNGTNIPDIERYPNGMAEIADYCHKKGMKFGLWTEIERIGEYSPVYREHPEWRPSSMYGKKSETYLDMTVPEAAKWAEDEISKIIENCKLDVLRVDHVSDSFNYFYMRDTGSGINECLSLRHYKAVYKMFENLRKKYPDMVFENCAGGGGRTDIGIMKYFNHTWVSDNMTMPRSVLIANGMTIALPPEKVDRRFSHTAFIHGSFDAPVRNAMLCNMSFGPLSPLDTDPNPIHIEFVKHSIDVYKNFIRTFLPDCNIYHHTPEASKCMQDGMCITEIASQDKSKGALSAISMSFAGEQKVNVCLKGVDEGKNYKVTLDNSRSEFVMSGFELKMNGLKLYIPTAMSSELVLYEEIL